MTKRAIVELELSDDGQVIDWFIVRLDDAGPWFDRVSAVERGVIGDIDDEYEFAQAVYRSLDAIAFVYGL